MSFNNIVKSEIEQHYAKRSVSEPELAELFLACGIVCDPQKEYRLEFHTTKHTPTQNLLKQLDRLGITAHSAVRGGRMLVYITASEQIEDLLTMMGAPHSALELMTVKIEKEVSNKANRIANCEIANVDKTAKTNSLLILSVERLRGAGITLPDPLLQAADFLLDHPEMSMAEMAKELKISKSGLYHRMQKIKGMAQKLNERT